MNIIVIIPARGGSKGLVNKNIMKLCGKPLLVWSIEAGIESKYIDEVIVSTDYKSIADTLITKKLMTSKVFSTEMMGQSSSNNLYRDVEKSLNKLISIFLDQWYKDNPFKQF